MSISQSLLPEFDQECATTRKVLERLPEDQYGWKPHEKSMRAGRLASHIAEMVGWGSIALTTGTYDFAPGGVPQIPAFDAASQAELLSAYDRMAGETRAAIAVASDEDYATVWTLLGNGRQILALPRGAVMRGFVISHMIHHRGQLSVYLRLLGVKVPSIYGPTADDKP